jgi:hypothetical protein
MANMILSTLLVLLPAIASCHTVISYPGWRGDNLLVNGSVEETNGLGVGISIGQLAYLYGMQWIYPCGGLPIASNRTSWPVSGSAVAFQPGWFAGHNEALVYINIGFGDVPYNYSVPLRPRLESFGPSSNPYPGTVCIPDLSVPAGFHVKPGDHATIQVVEAAVHGAAMYSVCISPTDTRPNELKC